ncbi:hypothetical protein [Sinisalibacter lacisalsi]|uniref:hypothetical protein n=1 Tax=Sinisalibacter lacisalsi TaxID=1526570 RepID=UPI0016679D1D|nr:hypothetical protein [Sinisalibacter lacisalsi]
MKQAIGLLALILAALALVRAALGGEAALVLAAGAVALMALMIAGTFLWLYFERTTPLALGMAFSWLGWGLFAGWGWAASLAGAPVWGGLAAGSLAVLGFCIVGAVLHFSVIHRSFGWHGASFLWPVALALALSGLVALPL